MARVGLPKSIIKKYGITKKAWSVYRGRRGKSRATRPKTRRTTRRSNPSMTRRNKRRSRAMNIVGTVEKFVSAGTFLAPGLARAQRAGGGLSGKAVTFLTTYGGIRDPTGNPYFDPGLLAEAWLPFVAFNTVRYGVHKLLGIIRRI